MTHFQFGSIIFWTFVVAAPTKASVQKLVLDSGWTCSERAYSPTTSISLCKGKIANYPETVRFYFNSQLAENEVQKLRLYLHGHRLREAPIFQEDESHQGQWGDFQNRIFESNSNSILAVPESTGKNETHKSFLANPTQFESFISEIMNLLKMKSVDLKVAGHSGGGSTVNRFLSGHRFASQVKAVYLFDVIYSSPSSLLRLLKINSTISVHITYVHFGTTNTETAAFLSEPTVVNAINTQQVKVTVLPASQKITVPHMNTLRSPDFLHFLN